MFMIIALFDVVDSAIVYPLSFHWPGPKHHVALSGVFVYSSNFHIVPHNNCVMGLLFQNLINGVVEVVCLFL